MQSSFWGYIDGYHWLYYSITKPWTLVAGTSEWALRMPSVFGAMFACVLMVVLAHKLFGQWVALVSGLLLATSPFFVKWSQQARGYTLLVAVSLLATVLFFLSALERGSRGAWALYGLAFSVVLGCGTPSRVAGTRASRSHLSEAGTSASARRARGNTHLRVRRHLGRADRDALDR